MQMQVRFPWIFINLMLPGLPRYHPCEEDRVGETGSLGLLARWQDSPGRAGMADGLGRPEGQDRLDHLTQRLVLVRTMIRRQDLMVATMGQAPVGEGLRKYPRRGTFRNSCLAPHSEQMVTCLRGVPGLIRRWRLG